MTSFHALTPRAADGSPYPLARHRGQVVLVVNTASRCGFTPQYEGLEALWRAHRAAGLVVLAFPCNQFGAQEPGDAAEIAGLCDRSFGVSFPILAKVAVNGPAADPVFRHLKAARPGILGIAAIKWNFTKFLVARDGRVIGRYAPRAKPAALEGAIRVALAEVGP